MPDKVDELYAKTLSFEKGLEKELNDGLPHNRFKILQKHIRFHILDILVQKYAENGADLIYFVLHHHHKGEQLSQRDITQRLKDILEKLDDDQKIRLIKEAAAEVAKILMNIPVTRKKVALTLKAKRTLMDRAMGDDFEEEFLTRLDTFDQKTLSNFISTFELPVRGQDEKNNGRACRKKLASHRTRQNEEMWSDPETRMALCKAMADAKKR